MISIITPFYNSEKYLSECINSVLNQTYTNFELLLINDGSTDNSLKIAEYYAQKDERIRLFDIKHIGFPKAKNFGLDKAVGNYITFLDSDDMVHQDWLKILYETIIKSNADIAVCKWITFKDTETILKYTKQINSYNIRIFTETKMAELWRIPCGSYLWNKLYKRELFNNVRFTDVISMSDVLVCPILFAKANFIALANVVLNFYRHHEDSMCHSASTIYGAQYWYLRAQIFTDMTLFSFNVDTAAAISAATKLASILLACSQFIDIKLYVEKAKPLLNAIKKEKLPKKFLKIINYEY